MQIKWVIEITIIHKVKRERERAREEGGAVHFWSGNGFAERYKKTGQGHFEYLPNVIEKKNTLIYFWSSFQLLILNNDAETKKKKSWKI